MLGQCGSGLGVCDACVEMFITHKDYIRYTLIYINISYAMTFKGNLSIHKSMHMNIDMGLLLVWWYIKKQNDVNMKQYLSFVLKLLQRLPNSSPLKPERT